MKPVLAAWSLALGSLLGSSIAQPQLMADPPTKPDGERLSEPPPKAMGVCPPFYLRDEYGNLIDPARGVNVEQPYSPKQTCAAKGCHDYATITEGYHFQQGRGEPVPEVHARRYAWVSSPGQYGGRW